MKKRLIKEQETDKKIETVKKVGEKIFKYGKEKADELSDKIKTTMTSFPTTSGGPPSNIFAPCINPSLCGNPLYCCTKDKKWITLVSAIPGGKSCDQYLSELGGGSTNVESDLPDWAKPYKTCLSCQAYAFKTERGDLVDLYQKVLVSKPSSGDIITLKDKFKLRWQTKTGKKYDGFWACENDVLVLGTCDKQMTKCGNPSWTAMPDSLFTQHCKKLQDGGGDNNDNNNNTNNDNKPPVTPGWDEKCTTFKKGCIGRQVAKLQKCLNKNKNSKLPDLVTDGKWGDDTTEKLKEIDAEYIHGISEDEILEICDKITPPPPKPIQGTLKLTKALGERIQIKEDTNVNVTGEISTLSDEDYFNKFGELGCATLTINAKNLTTNQDEQLKIQNQTSTGALTTYTIGEGGQPRNGFVINADGRYYVFFRDSGGLITDVNSNSVTHVFKWNCPALNKYVLRVKPPIFKKLNVDYNLQGEDLYDTVNDRTEFLQGWINYGVKSNDIIKWNKMLNTTFKDTGDVAKLSLTSEQIKNLKVPSDPETLKNKYKLVPNDRVTPYTIVMYVDVNKQLQKSEQLASGDSPETCKTNLITYLQRAALSAAGINTPWPNRDYFVNSVYSCKSSGVYSSVVLKRDEVFPPASYPNEIQNSPFTYYNGQMNWEQIKTYLFGTSKKYKGQALPQGNQYIINLNESKLTSLIKSTLTEVIVDRKKLVLQEDVLRTRVGIIFENTTFKTRKQRRNFVINLLKEALVIDSQGFDKNIVNEEFWGAVKGFFGDEGSEAVFESFKTRMGEWLVNHLSPKKRDGWISKCIKKAIQEVEIRDVHKITDCKFLTREISRCVIEKLDEKMSNEDLKDEGLYDVVRNGMYDNIKSVRFKDHIENKVSGMICPILYDMSNRFDSTFDKMKKRAIGF